MWVRSPPPVPNISESGGIGIRSGLRSRVHGTCGFESHLSHIEEELNLKNIFLKSAITEYNNSSNIEDYLQMIRINNKKIKDAPYFSEDELK